METFSVGFVRTIFDGDETLINFNARDDAFADEVIDKGLTVVGILAGSFIEEDDTIDVIFEIWGSEKDIAVIATVVVGVGDV